MHFHKIPGEIKSPLRYPGGKSKVLDKIIRMIPNFKAFREPFVGGGSVFIAVKQRVSSTIPIMINDLYNDLYCFWKILQENPDELIHQVEQIKNRYSELEKIREFIRNNTWNTDLQKAVRYFIMNRITDSGSSDSGGFTQNTFERQLTPSSIQSLKQLKEIMGGIRIYNEDYERFLFDPGEGVFIFLDPPYLKEAKKPLYGKDGDLNLSFNHERFAENMRKCKHKWLITYNDAPKIRQLFSFAHILEWELLGEGKELFICNYA